MDKDLELLEQAQQNDCLVGELEEEIISNKNRIIELEKTIANIRKGFWSKLQSSYNESNTKRL